MKYYKTKNTYAAIPDKDIQWGEILYFTFQGETPNKGTYFLGLGFATVKEGDLIESSFHYYNDKVTLISEEKWKEAYHRFNNCFLTITTLDFNKRVVFYNKFKETDYYKFLTNEQKIYLSYIWDIYEPIERFHLFQSFLKEKNETSLVKVPEYAERIYCKNVQELFNLEELRDATSLIITSYGLTSL